MNVFFYMVFVEGKPGPTYKHENLDHAKEEAERLVRKEGKETYVLGRGRKEYAGSSSACSVGFSGAIMTNAVKQGLKNNIAGHDFEQTVANWAKYFFREYAPTAITFAERARGCVCAIPYDVDVRVNFKNGGILGFLKDENDVWVECKYKTTNHVKRAEVQQLILSAQDVWRGYKKGVGRGYNALAVVTNMGFDGDALNVANSQGVLCVCLRDGRAVTMSTTKNWLEDPAWLPEED